MTDPYTEHAMALTNLLAKYIITDDAGEVVLSTTAATKARKYLERYFIPKQPPCDISLEHG